MWKHIFERYQYFGVYSAAGSEHALGALRRVTWNREEIAQFFDLEKKLPTYHQSPWEQMRNYASAPFTHYVLSLLSREEAQPRVLESLAVMPAEERMRALELMRELLPHFAPSAEFLQTLLRYSAPIEINSAALWHGFAATSVSRQTVREVWGQLFVLSVPPAASAPAIEILRRAELSADEIFVWMRDVRKFDVANLALDFLAALLRRSPQSLLEIVTRADAEKQRVLRELLLKQLQNEAFLLDFWNAAWPQLRDASTREGQSEEEAARSRETARQLVREETIARTFSQLPAAAFEEFLATDEDEHERLLSRWLDAHLEALRRESNTLLLAAMCPLSAIHTRALERLRVLALNLPIALRLMESGLPLAMREAERFFQNAPRGSDDETRFALALCDSPQAETRAAGIRFLEARRDTLITPPLLQQLGENPDPKMQSWLAREYSRMAISPETTADFDRAVLRVKGRARRAKEAVKTRLTRSATETQVAENSGAQNIDALLELARGNVARDREWALQQLALLKISGANVPDFEIVGT